MTTRGSVPCTQYSTRADACGESYYFRSQGEVLRCVREERDSHGTRRAWTRTAGPRNNTVFRNARLESAEIDDDVPRR